MQEIQNKFTLRLLWALKISKMRIAASKCWPDDDEKKHQHRNSIKLLKKCLLFLGFLIFLNGLSFSGFHPNEITTVGLPSTQVYV